MQPWPPKIELAIEMEIEVKSATTGEQKPEREIGGGGGNLKVSETRPILSPSVLATGGLYLQSARRFAHSLFEIFFTQHFFGGKWKGWAPFYKNPWVGIR